MCQTLFEVYTYIKYNISNPRETWKLQLYSQFTDEETESRSLDKR